MIHPFTGAELKQGGITVAIDHANMKHDGWADKAYELLMQFISWHKAAFLCETLRLYAETEGLLPAPPSNRAYGAIILRAKREGAIVHAGYAQVHNPKAHMANASLWIKTKVGS